MSARERYKTWWLGDEPDTLERLQARCAEQERKLVAMDQELLTIEKKVLADVSDDALVAEVRRRGFGWPTKGNPMHGSAANWALWGDAL